MQNAFEFFGVSPTLNLDLKEIRVRYIEIQRKGHPDLVGDGVEGSIEAIELANRYYEALQSPRGVVKLYLEAMHAIDLNQNRLPEDFLMEMMALNDEIDQKHAGNEEAGLKAQRMLDEAEMDLTNALNELKSTQTPPLDALIEWYQKSKYLDRLRKNFLGIEEI